MSFMDKFLQSIQLSGDADDGYYDEPDENYPSKVESISSGAPIGKDDPSIEVSEEKLKKTSPKPSTRPKKMSSSGMEVCVIKPTSVEDAREITETLLANRTVVLNLEGLDVDIAQRIIDLLQVHALLYPAIFRRSQGTFSSSHLLLLISRVTFRISFQVPSAVELPRDPSR